LRNNIFFGSVHATQTQQTISPSHNGIGACDQSIQEVSALRLRRYGRQNWKINIMLMNCNLELLSGKNFKCIKYFIELVIS